MTAIDRRYQAHPARFEARLETRIRWRAEARERKRAQRHARLRASVRVAGEAFVLGLGFVLFIFALTWGAGSVR